MKTRLLGAAVLFALAVLFVPMFFSSSPPAPGGDQQVSLDIPPAPDRDLKTQTMSLNPSAAPAATASGTTTVTPSGGSDQLATVNIGSRRPRDVETDPQAGKAPEPTTVTRPAGNPATVPVIPDQTQKSASDTNKSMTGDAGKASTSSGTAARGAFSVNLGAYASASSVQNLQQKARGLGYATSTRAMTASGKSLTLVSAGPFETRAAAEAARLKLIAAVPHVAAKVTGSASDQLGDVATPTTPPAARVAAPTPANAAAKPTPRAGGYAVQLAAMSSQTGANALRDKLRGAGFDGFVDQVSSGGRSLWRVRAGPQTQKADAERVRDQIKAKLGLAGTVVGAP